jgi:hypothetical protein
VLEVDRAHEAQDEPDLSDVMDRPSPVRPFTPHEDYQPRHRADVPVQ